MNSDAKQSESLVLEVVGGTGRSGSVDGALSRCQFGQSFGLCRLGDSLIITDNENHTVRQVTGVLGVANPLAHSNDADAVGPVGSEYEAQAIPLLTAVIAALPKELARLMAQYARPGGRVTTIAGAAGNRTHVDGPALSAARLVNPTGIGVDTSDVVAGPRLIIGEGGTRCVRCLTLSTGLVTTIAGTGGGESGYVDGPASVARFTAVWHCCRAQWRSVCQ